MSSKWGRFEVLLPLEFNDGRDVPDTIQSRGWMKDTCVRPKVSL